MSKLIIIQMIAFYSNIYGVSPEVSLAVAQKESSLNPQAIGPKKELGLFQLLPSSFPNYTKKQLLDPATNISLGVQYLAQMKKECVHKNNNDWLVCYNFGLQNAKKVKHPSLFPYVRQVASLMEVK